MNFCACVMAVASEDVTVLIVCFLAAVFCMWVWLWLSDPAAS